MGKIPEGLIKCEVCNIYRGEVMGRDINWGVYVLRDEMEKMEEPLTILCLCESTLLCSKCKKNKIYRSGSMRYDERDNSIWFRPCFASLVPCKECRTKGGTVVDSCPAQA